MPATESGNVPGRPLESPLSDTRLNYTRPGFDDDPAVLVVGDVDPHLGVDLDLVRGVGSWRSTSAIESRSVRRSHHEDARPLRSA